MGGTRRRTVTAIFADVVGSTSIAEDMDPEVYAALMSRFFSEMSAVVERHGGVVEKFIGDAIKASFGVPLAREDDALRAVRAATGMRQSLATLNVALRERWNVELQMRIGINTGEVMSMNQGGQAVALGDAMNIAARLQQEAAAGEILVGHKTIERVRDAVDAELLEPLSLKGKTSEVIAYRLRGVDATAEAIRRHLDRPMIGRSDELRLVLDACERSQSAEGCALINVSGEPGIGESRLLAEAEARLRAQGVLVLTGGCAPYGEGVTYGAIRQVIFDFVHAVSDDDGDSRSALEAVTANVAERELVTNRLFQIAGLDEATAPPEELFWGVRKFLEEIAHRQPLAVVIEDLHWGERSLIDLLDHIVDWTRDAHVVLLSSFRPEFLERHAHWERKAEVTVRLERLSPRDAQSLAENVAEGVGVGSTTLEHLVSVSGGNPLFIEQMVSMVEQVDATETSGGPTASIPIAPSLQAVLAARLDALHVREREALEAAAIVGSEFAARAVHQLVDRGELVDLLRTLQSLEAKNLIAPERWDSLTGPGFSFRHALIRDAAYGAISRELRADLHQRLAMWLESQDPAPPPEVIGHHYEQAVRSLEGMGTDDQRRQLATHAADLLQEAGASAHARRDMAAAADLLWRAWLLLKSLRVYRFELAMLLDDAVFEEIDIPRAKLLVDQYHDAAQKGDVRFEAASHICEVFVRLRSDTNYLATEARERVQEALRIYQETGARGR